MRNLDFEGRKKKIFEFKGMRYVGQIVAEYWECGWQPLDARNDQGIDGMIINKVKGVPIGTVIKVQVKCGISFFKNEDDDAFYPSIGDSVGMEKHKAYWMSQHEPVILCVVLPGSKFGQEKAWWADLKNEDTYHSKAQLKVLKKNRFAPHSKGEIFKLNKKNHEPLEAIYPDFNWFYKIQKETSVQSREYYKELSKTTRTCGALNGEIVFFNRVGWRHITGRSRKITRINQSKMLLPFVLSALKNVKSATFVRSNIPSSKVGTKFIVRQKLSLRFKAKYPDGNRNSAPANIILLRKIEIENGIVVAAKNWFYSIHYLKV